MAEAHGNNLHVHREGDCHEDSDGTQDRAYFPRKRKCVQEYFAVTLDLARASRYFLKYLQDVNHFLGLFCCLAILDSCSTQAALRSLELRASFRHSPSNNPKLRVPAVFHHYNLELLPLVTGSPQYLYIQI